MVFPASSPPTNVHSSGDTTTIVPPNIDEQPSVCSSDFGDLLAESGVTTDPISTMVDSNIGGKDTRTISPNALLNENSSILEDLETPIVEISYQRLPFCDPHLKPVVGKQFPNLEQGIDFYDKYATAAGFVMRLDSETKKHGEIQYKRCVCNMQGNSQPVGTKRKKQLIRVGCEAKIIFKRVENGKYEILRFVEGHSHILASPDTMVHLKQSRELNIVHKKMIVDNSRVNQGAIKSYRMLKEYVKGYGNIGASLEDFKNFSRDVKSYIKEYDAQMIIEIFMQKKVMCSSFYFDFDKDENGRLTRLFWADPICIRNYSLFGHTVSFDTTFGMNKYRLVFAPFTGLDHHKRCVTFAAGLIAKETIESFAWLFDNFVTAMGGRSPDCIITDQDLGIKGGIEKVFGDKVQHKYCMWHIMKKVTDKIGTTICKDTEFLKDLNACVWNEEIDPPEFEEQWNSIISSYELDDNDWLKQMYEMRKSWIPAYFRDLFLAGLIRTTSISESVNSFFGNFTNPHLSIVEFYMRFESAMDAQRWKQSKLNAECKTSFPRLETPLQLEKHASEFYTPTIFNEFQEELKGACFSCFLKSSSKDVTENTCVMDSERDKMYTVDVDSNSNELKVACSCKRFERHGVLCRHALYVLKERGCKSVPTAYLLSRWSKTATSRPIINVDDTFLTDCASFSTSKNKTNELWSEIFTCVSLVENDEKHMGELLELISEFKEKMALKTNGSKKKKDKKAEIGRLIGASIPDEVTIFPPSQSKNKGSGKRIVSEKEKAIKETNQALRKCAACGAISTHDRRNCPLFPYKKPSA